MKFVLALVALIAASVVAQPYSVTSVYSDNQCTTLIGQYITAPGSVSSKSLKSPQDHVIFPKSNIRYDRHVRT